MDGRDRIPAWLRRPVTERVASGPGRSAVRGLTTVCDEARCPNRGECIGGERTATFMLLGPGCSRNCGFCSVRPGPGTPDGDEPRRVAAAVAALGLSYAVLTMTTRDDLGDGGAQHVAAAVTLIAGDGASRRVEVLTSDFGGVKTSVDRVLEAGVSVFGHNVETAPSLYEAIRPGASYGRSLRVLERAAARGAITKSAFMVGLGETEREIRSVMKDLREVGVDILAVGQYLRPGLDQVPVKKYWEEEAFAAWEEEARRLGFKAAACGPFVRSSYRAAALYDRASL